MTLNRLVEVFIRNNSTITLKEIVIKYRELLRNREIIELEKFYYIEIFDSRDLQSYRLFSEIGTKYFNITNSVVKDNIEILGIIQVSSMQSTVEETNLNIIPINAIKFKVDL